MLGKAEVGDHKRTKWEASVATFPKCLQQLSLHDVWPTAAFSLRSPHCAQRQPPNLLSTVTRSGPTDLSLIIPNVDRMILSNFGLFKMFLKESERCGDNCLQLIGSAFCTSPSPPSSPLPNVIETTSTLLSVMRISEINLVSLILINHLPDHFKQIKFFDSCRLSHPQAYSLAHIDVKIFRGLTSHLQRSARKCFSTIFPSWEAKQNLPHFSEMRGVDHKHPTFTTYIRKSNNTHSKRYFFFSILEKIFRIYEKHS